MRLSAKFRVTTSYHKLPIELRFGIKASAWQNSAAASHFRPGSLLNLNCLIRKNLETGKNFESKILLVMETISTFNNRDQTCLR
jgi:hypothetical protein